MARRHRALAWILGVPLLLVLALLLFLSSPRGTRFIVSKALPMMNRQINGHITVRETRGSVFGRLDLRGVTLTDLSGKPLLTAERVVVGYRVLDLLRGRIQLDPVILEKPWIELVQNQPGEPYPLLTVLSKNPNPAARSAFIVRGLEITDGSVVATVPTTRRPVGSEQAGPEPLLRRVEIGALDAKLPLLQVASGGRLPMDVEARIDEASAEVSEPKLSLRSLEGHALVRGDSVSIDLKDAALPGSSLTAKGWLVLNPVFPRFDGDLQIAELSTADLTGILPQLPPDWHVRGDIHATGDSAGAMTADMQLIEVRAGKQAGSIRGHVGMDVTADGRWRQRDTELDVVNLDLAPLVRHLKRPPSIPISGRWSGRILADGPQDSLDVRVNLAVRQPMAGDPAVSTLNARGEVGVPLGGVIAFRNVTIDTARIDMRSVRAANPGIPLVGRMEGKGQLNGSLADLAFQGTARYQEGNLPPSDLRATVKLARHSPFHLDADLELDSLRLDGFRKSFPSMASGAGAVGGRLHLTGPLDTLTVSGNIGGEPGRLRLAGIVGTAPGVIAVRDADVQADSVNLAAINPRFPKSFLFARVAGSASMRDSTLESANFRLAVDSSRVGGMNVETASLVARTRGGLLLLDSLVVRGTGLRVDGGGTLGLKDRRGTVTVRVHADSLDQLGPLFEIVDTAGTMTPHSGSVLVDATVTGSVESYVVEFKADAQRVVMATAALRTGAFSGSLAWPDRRFTLVAEVDSVRVSGVTAERIDATAEGTPTALAWTGAASFSHNGRAAGTGKISGDWIVGRTFELDSLSLTRDSATWRLEKPARIGLQNDRWEFSNTVLVRAGPGDPGRIAITGALTAKDSSGRVSAVIESFPLCDLAIYPSTGPGSALQGTVDARFDLAGSVKNPTGTGQFSLLDGKYDTLALPELRGKADYNGGVLAAALSIIMGSRPSVLEARIPMNRDAADNTARLSFLADSLAVDWLDPLVPTVQDLTGRLDGKVEMTGTFESPNLSGGLTFTGGEARILPLGVRYHSVAGKLSFAGETVRVEQLAIETGDEGENETLAVTGTMTLEELNDPTLDLDVNARHFAVMKDEYFFNGDASGDLKLTGPFFATTVTGNARVDHGTMYVDEFIQKRVIDLSDPLFAQFVDTTVLRKERLGADPIALFIAGLYVDGLQADLGDELWLKSSDANIQIGGEVALAKIGRRYAIEGTVNTLRGTYTLRLAPGTSREFVIEQGTIRYLGTSDLNATLDINASHELQTQPGDPLTVMVHIGGTIEAPRIDLTSSMQPALNESEVISYLVFGVPSFQAFVNDRSGQRRSVFEQSVKSFTGVLSGTLEQSLGAWLPLDYFRIQPGEIQSGLSGTELIMGKQVSLFGKPSWLKASPRLCPRNSLLAMDQIGLSLETRLSLQWGLIASLDPLRGCETSLPPASSHYGMGLDVFWEKRGISIWRRKK